MNATSKNSDYDDMWAIVCFADGARLYMAHSRPAFPYVLVRPNGEQVACRLLDDGGNLEGVLRDSLPKGDWAYFGGGKGVTFATHGSPQREVTLTMVDVSGYKLDQEVDAIAPMNDEDHINWFMVLGTKGTIDSFGGPGMSREDAEEQLMLLKS